MSYILVEKEKTVYPYSIGRLREDNPNTSFPEWIDDKFLESMNVFEVVICPKDNDYTKDYIELEPKLIDGKWIQQWEVKDASQDQINQRLENRWGEIRLMRNRFLAECDWTQLRDAPFSENKRGEWVIYRQALRDITKQSDPFKLVWPVKPL